MVDEKQFDIDEYLNYLKTFGVDVSRANLILKDWAVNQEKHLSNS